MEAAERRSLRCVWVSGGRALTEQEAANEIVSEARLLLQEDLARLGVQWDPGQLPPQAPTCNNADEDRSNHSATDSGTSLGSSNSSPETREGHGFKTTRGRDIDRQRRENKDELKRVKGHAGMGMEERMRREGKNR